MQKGVISCGMTIIFNCDTNFKSRNALEVLGTGTSVKRKKKKVRIACIRISRIKLVVQLSQCAVSGTGSRDQAM